MLSFVVESLPMQAVRALISCCELLVSVAKDLAQKCAKAELLANAAADEVNKGKSVDVKVRVTQPQCCLKSPISSPIVS